jgi:hypothetical protein
MSVAETLAPGVNTSSLLHPVFAVAFRAHVQLRRSALTRGRSLNDQHHRSAPVQGQRRDRCSEDEPKE